MLETGYWRAEIWHPLSVHAPLVLLPVSTITLLIAFFFKSDSRKIWHKAACLLLCAGCLTAWIAIYTGNLADGVVARKICDPTILKQHQLAAQTMTYLFTTAAILNIVSLTVLLPRLQRGFCLLAILLQLVGTGYLLRAGHLGSSLVYQQGAGVENHAVDCSQFE